MAAEEHNGGRSPSVNATQADHSVDDLAKGLAEGTISRRKALRMLAGVLLGGALASVPEVAWAAKPVPCPSGVKCGKKCCPDSSFVCSSRRCACPTGTTNLGTTCCPNAQVCGQRCGCAAGEGCCSDACTPLNTVTDCGTCGNACAQGASCVGGTCQCPSGQELCGGQCVSGCTGEQVLNPSTCRCECPTGTTLCPGNNTCVQNCPQGQTLNATSCQCENIVCPGGTVLCGGQCVQNGCAAGEVFNATTCQCEGCPSGQEPCGGQCVQSCSGSRVLNASTCECECPTDVGCTSTGGTVNATTCVCECPAGKTLCQGQCVTSCDTTIGEVLNPDTCQCESPPDACADITCPPGSTCCVPPSGEPYCAPIFTCASVGPGFCAPGYTCCVPNFCGAPPRCVPPGVTCT